VVGLAVCTLFGTISLWHVALFSGMLNVRYLTGQNRG
jgi:hypothetical protein